MNKDIDAQFLCKDCERYNLCQYYDRRKEDSYICKYFHLSAEPCEDAISRQAVLDLMRGLTRWGVRSQDGKFDNVGLLYDDVMFGLDRLPSVTPKQKMGRWIPVSESIPGDATNDDALNIMLLQTFPKIRFSRVIDELNKTQKIVMSEEWLDSPYKAESED